LSISISTSSLLLLAAVVATVVRVVVARITLNQGSQTHLGVRATLQDITQSVGHSVFRDDKMQYLIGPYKWQQLFLQYTL